jgi:hypothetical protein
LANGFELYGKYDEFKSDVGPILKTHNNNTLCCTNAINEHYMKQSYYMCKCKSPICNLKYRVDVCNKCFKITIFKNDGEHPTKVPKSSEKSRGISFQAKFAMDTILKANKEMLTVTFNDHSCCQK